MRAADLIRIRHMLDAAKEAVAFIQDRQRADIASDRMLALALTKDIEIVGEAASKVSTEIQDKYPQIPWANITGMRNRLIHAYFDIDSDRVWDTVNDDLPILISELEKIIASEKEE